MKLAHYRAVRKVRARAVIGTAKNRLPPTVSFTYREAEHLLGALEAAFRGWEDDVVFIKDREGTTGGVRDSFRA